MNTKITKIHEGHEGLRLILMPVCDAELSAWDRHPLIDQTEDAEGTEDAGDLH